MGTEELNKKAAIDYSAKHSNYRSQSREEGELSSYDDDDVLDRSESSFIKSNASQENTIRADRVTSTSEDVKAGMPVPSTSSGDIVELPARATLHSSHQKSFEKDRGSFVPFVISFSDEDSGSDHEESEEKNALVGKGKPLPIERSKRPPLPSLSKPQPSKHTTRNLSKMIPRKPSLSRTFVSSTNKIHGATSGNGSSSGLNCLPKSNVLLNPTKLQDLRQMIAIRENELKLKSSKNHKSSGLHVNRTSHAVNLGNDMGKQGTLSELKEPDKKRLKITEPHLNTMDASSQEVVESISASKNPSIENDCQQISGNCYHQKGKSKSGKSCTTHAEGQRQDAVPVSSKNVLIGAKKGFGATGHQTERMSKLPYSSVSSELHLANKETETIPKKSRTAEVLLPSELDGQFTAVSTEKNYHNKVTDRSDQSRLNEKVPGPILDKKYQESLNYPSFWKNLVEVTARGNSNIDAKSLLDLEELQDKELEAAQEHRRQCEIEERNALKAYRNAQKALVEATARCNYLYNKRELYSAHLRNLMMNNSNLFLSFRSDDHNGAALKFTNNITEFNRDAIPTLSCRVRTDNETSNNDGGDLNVVPANDSIHVGTEKLPFGRFSEPDGSTSEAHNEAGIASGACFPSDNSSLETRIKASEANGVCSPSGDSSMSVDDDEGSRHFTRKPTKDNLEVGKDSNGGQEMLSFDSIQDSLVLEASLRSQLFERLGKKTLSKNGESSQSTLPPDEGRSENVDAGKNLKASALEGTAALLSNANKNCQSELQGEQSTTYSALSCPVVKSVIYHLRVAEAQSSQLLIKSPEIASPGINSENDKSPVNLDPVELPSADTCYRKIGSYSCNLAINPFWPLCMYELRGKCNNDECPWQHVRDYKVGNMMPDVSSEYDSQSGSLSRGRAKSLSDFLLAPPTYLVGLDGLKADTRYNSILSRGHGQCWRKCFSASMVLSSLLPTYLPLNEPFLLGTEARKEVHGAWDRQSFYFHSKSGKKSKAGHSTDDEQFLEMVLLNLYQETDKEKGRMEALKAISRALEANATSAVLWIIYLQIYYCNQKSIGKDDLVRYAVEFNETSYELWVMYINSREKLIDRLAAYDAALLALCCNVSNSDRDARHASGCILDIFVQMMNCLCMSGNVEKAIQKIYGLFPTTAKSDNSLSFSLADIINRFTISDSCIFWVCCVYLVIYRKLPDSIVQRIECWEKEISTIEWPSIHLSFDEKQKADSLMELALDSLALHMDSKSIQSETTLRVAHLFAINHVKCVQVLEGLESSKNLLKNYAKLYRSCLELVLMLVRVENDTQNSSFVGFLEALSNWHDEIPGIQCVWNQYAECALRNGNINFTKELMYRWFDSWKIASSQNGTLNTLHDASSEGALRPASVSDLESVLSHHEQVDIVFALLNFSLYKILQNDENEARLALERALEAATTAENYSYCVGEHVQYLFRKRSGNSEGILMVMNNYLDDAPSSSSEPLSRDFIQKVEKPRLRQLISKLLSPVSSDCSLVNLILEVLYGPSLLPQMSDRPTDLVDFVESLMEIRPANYQLAISVCKWLSSNSGNVTNDTISFWASSLLVNSLFQAVPIAPESAWVETANILQNLMDSLTLCESFLQRALSVYPFSISLWRCYLNLSMSVEHSNSVKEEARQKGIILD